MKITFEYVLKLIDEQEKKKRALVRVIDTRGEDHITIALPDRDLTLRKEDVLFIEYKIANILKKAQIVEFIDLEGKHDALGEHRAENMADVEG